VFTVLEKYEMDFYKEVRAPTTFYNSLADKNSNTGIKTPTQRLCRGLCGKEAAP
jgi:hypothetical protein